MRPHTKFRANRSIFCEVMTFHIFSRWLPSAVLNFEKFIDKFSRVESKSASAHRIWSKSDDRRPRYCDKTEIQYGRRHVEFTSGLLFDTFWRLRGQDVSAYRISCKSDHISGEFITFHKFSRWRRARSRDITICNSGPHTKSPWCSEHAVQIWRRNLDYFWIYRNFSILSCCM